jgi:hypothetical protein
MTNKPLDIAGFLRLVIDALNAAWHLVGDIPALDEKGEPAATRRDDGSWME